MERPANGRSKDFCSDTCRHRFNNRRRVRGADLYDLKMAERYERDDAGELNLLSKMNRLCASWREEDRQRRGGRRSWGDWRGWLERNPWVGEGVLKHTQAQGLRQRVRRQKRLMEQAIEQLHDTNLSPSIQAAIDQLREALALGEENGS